MACIEPDRCPCAVQQMGHVLHGSRSGEDAGRQRPPRARTRTRQRRAQRIQEIFDGSGQRYGSPNITAPLHREGEPVPQKTVAPFMRAQGLRSRVVRRYKATTHSGHGWPVSANVLNQTFRAARPNQVWMTDSTYCPTDEGWLYLASVEDLYTRQIVGGATDTRMTQDLTWRALDQAYRRQRPPAGVLPHSDRGSP